MNAAMMLVCMAGSLSAGQRDKPVFEAPLIEVRHDQEFGPNRQFPYSYLMYHHTYMGRNFHKPKNRDDYGNPDVDFSRLPTTYFHDKGPIGMVLKRYNWFPGKTNTFHADARLPASLLATVVLDPYANLANLWSEPPVAVLGMDVGTLAAYARPTQAFHFTERTPIFVKMSLPDKGETRHFHFIQDALDRGADVRIFEGEPRDMLEKKGGDGFYQIIVIETYKLPVVEVHKELMTKEAMQMMLGKLREGGILCYHTSNRYYDLVPIITNAATKLKCAFVVGRSPYDETEGSPRHRFSSEWVMVARKAADLAHLEEPPDLKLRPGEKFWTRDYKSEKKILWTDKGENSFRGVYRSDPSIDLFRDSIYRFVHWAGDRVGVPNRYLYQTMQPVDNAMRAWSERSARELNRELPKGKGEPKQ